MSIKVFISSCQWCFFLFLYDIYRKTNIFIDYVRYIIYKIYDIPEYIILYFSGSRATRRRRSCSSQEQIKKKRGTKLVLRPIYRRCSVWRAPSKCVCVCVFVCPHLFLSQMCVYCNIVVVSEKKIYTKRDCRCHCHCHCHQYHQRVLFFFLDDDGFFCPTFMIAYY